MTTRGFSLVELLVAMVIVVLLTATIAAAAASARSLFDRLPAVIDMQQRGTAALDELSQALRSAVQVTAEVPGDAGGYSQLTVVTPIASPGQGVLALDQAAPAASLMLALSPCPNIKDVCGFTPGTVAMIADSGGFDVFVVAATNATLRRVTPSRALSHAYAAGAVVIEVDQRTYGLDEQSDGTFALTRVTAAGAVQPIVDGIRSLSFNLDDHRVAVEVVVHALSDISRERVADRTFRRSITVRNLP